MSKDLKTCPFCGDEPVKFEASTGWFIECANSRCHVNPSLLEPRHRLEDATEAWNRRADQPAGAPSNKADVMADEARKRVSGYTAEKKAELEARGREALRQANTPSSEGGEG